MASNSVLTRCSKNDEKKICISFWLDLPKLNSPELQKCYFLYNHKQICSKVPIILYFFRPKRPSGTHCQFCSHPFSVEFQHCLLTNIFFVKTQHSILTFLDLTFFMLWKCTVLIVLITDFRFMAPVCIKVYLGIHFLF